MAQLNTMNKNDCAPSAETNGEQPDGAQQAVGLIKLEYQSETESANESRAQALRDSLALQTEKQSVEHRHTLRELSYQ